MDNIFRIEVSQYQLGLIASTIREKLSTATDGSSSMSAEDRRELQNLLANLQNLKANDKCA